MLEQFGRWFIRHNTEVTWWLIGWLTFAGIDALANGNLFWAIVDAGLIYFNYYMWKTRQ